MPTMWADYFREKGFLVEENDKGFISAIIHNGTCLVDNWYVKPEHRKSVAAMRLVFKMIQNAKDRGCVFFCGEIYKVDPLFSYSLNMHRKFGMEIVEENENHVVTCKRIK